MRTPLRNLLFFGLVFFPHALYTASSPVKVRVAGEIRVQSDPQSAIAAPERCPGSSVLGPPWSDGGRTPEQCEGVECTAWPAIRAGGEPLVTCVSPHHL